MAKTKEVKEPADKEQSARFIETARALGVDETGKAFNKALKVITPKREAVHSRPSEKKYSA